MKIRTAELSDLPSIYELEQASFAEGVASDRRALRRSILSAHQKVFVLEEEKVVACAIVYIHKKSVRLYSIAVSKDVQNKGYGRILLSYCEEYALKLNKEIMTLEADAQNIKLINWYAAGGFSISSYAENYYGKGLPAYVMKKKLSPQRAVKEKVKNIIVTDRPYDLSGIRNAEIVQAEDYIKDTRFQESRLYRVFNFCSSYQYQSVGYYISLLAEARGQRVFPSVATMQDILSNSIVQIFAEELRENDFSDFRVESGSRVVYRVILGCEAGGRTSKLSKRLYKLFDAPFVEYTFVRGARWLLEKVRLMTISEVLEIEEIPVDKIASFALSKRSFGRRMLTNYQYSMAILVNPDEEHPPSDKTALEKFRTAGISNGFYVEFITKEDSQRINEFDVLFIRETTAVNDYTYQISRSAEAEGLVVIDDPWSILKCSNKLFLYEKMKQAKVKMPKSGIVSNSDFESPGFELDFNYPVIIKQPDSAFSLGVYKADSADEFKEKCAEIMKTSEFAVVQEFIQSDYDWRIGIMNNEPLFACKYYMAHSHWQIYNWSGEGEDVSGRAETFGIEDVPPLVLETALKAASVIGDGLYGVDLKFVGDDCYLIEVNDNPNIDSGIEDAVLQDVLYDRIIRNMKSRLVERQSQQKKICM